MQGIKMNAYAKINLFLDIEGIRDDGYHNIISVMQSVSLCDEVRLTYDPNAERRIEISCSNDDIPLGRDNIAYKAADKLLTKGSVRIYIEKRIPAAAGLAGGSADAAATLILLNKLISEKSEAELVEIGATIGADVPFCMLGGTKLVRGIGEIKGDFPRMPDCNILIACGGEGVSTPRAYAELDKIYGGFEEYSPRYDELDVLKDTGNIEKWSRGLFNIFESAVLPNRPVAADIKKIMLEHGATAAMMSGSGPAIFGIFQDKEPAMAAAQKLRYIGVHSHVCRPI